MAATDFKIEKGVPPPFRSGRQRFPFADMAVGDSVVITLENKSYQSTLAGYASRNHAPWKFIGRKEGEGMRIWRIA